jgi:hypothetical protein
VNKIMLVLRSVRRAGERDFPVTDRKRRTQRPLRCGMKNWEVVVEEGERGWILVSTLLVETSNPAF